MPIFHLRLWLKSLGVRICLVATVVIVYLSYTNIQYRATSGPPVKRHSNGFRWRVDSSPLYMLTW